MLETKRWVNPSQPQLLQIAVFLLYFRAAFMLLGALSIRNADAYILLTIVDFVDSEGAVRVVLLALAVLMVLGGNGTANERKLGYNFALAAAIIPIACRLYASTVGSFPIGLLDEDVIGLMFDVALVAMLVHPQSREYQRIWFK
jgi:hypothetical protein